MKQMMLVLAISAVTCSVPLQGQEANDPTGVSESLAADLDLVRDATKRFHSHEAAVASGYRRFGKVEGPLMGEHWFRKDEVAAGFDIGEALPEGFSGTSDDWHVHDIERIAGVLSEGRPLLGWVMQRRIRAGEIGGGDGRTRPAMLHAWVWEDNPDGVFALEHRGLPYLRAGLSAEYARAGDAAAAAGVALLDVAACQRDNRLLRGVARVPRERRGKVLAACEDAAAEMRALQPALFDAAAYNRAAAAAWSAYDALRNQQLTAAERGRLAAMREDHPPGAAHAH